MINIWKKMALFASLLCLLITSTMEIGSRQEAKANAEGLDTVNTNSQETSVEQKTSTTEAKISTEKVTTEKATTEKATTEKVTTEKKTTEKVTTEKATTEKATAEKKTTENSITEKTTEQTTETNTELETPTEQPVTSSTQEVNGEQRTTEAEKTYTQISMESDSENRIEQVSGNLPTVWTVFYYNGKKRCSSGNGSP